MSTGGDSEDGFEEDDTFLEAADGDPSDCSENASPEEEDCDDSPSAAPADGELTDEQEQKGEVALNDDFESTTPALEHGDQRVTESLDSPFLTVPRESASPPPPRKVVTAPPSPRVRRPAGGSVKDRAMRLQSLGHLPFSAYQELLDELECDKRRFLADSNLHELTRIAMAITHVEAYRQTAQKTTVYKRLSAGHAEEVASVREELRAFDSETKGILSTLLKQQAEQRDAVRDAHAAELRSLVDSWKSDERMRRYNRPPNALIVRRRQLDLLMHAGQYGLAELVQQEIDSIEKEEAAGRLVQIKADYREAHRKMQIRHADEEAALDRDRDVERQLVMQRRAQERRVLANVMHKLDVKREAFGEPEKAWQYTKVARMNEISKNKKKTPPRQPATPRASVRARGRFEQQARPVRLPPLDFDHM
jgi:hypothetical protein